MNNSYLSSNSNSSSIILKQLVIQPSEIDTEDVIFYAKLIGIDPISEPELLWIARTGLISPLPNNWIAVEDKKGRLYYFDQKNKKSSWEHPSDEYYRSLVRLYRANILSGLVDIPLASSQLSLTNSAMSGFSTVGGNITSSLANLHFFDDDDEDDDNSDKKKNNDNNTKNDTNGDYNDNCDELATKNDRKEQYQAKNSGVPRQIVQERRSWITTTLPLSNDDHLTKTEYTIITSNEKRENETLRNGDIHSSKEENNNDENREESIESVVLEIENEIEEVSFEQSIEEVIEEINDDIELIVEDNASIESIQKDNEEINGLIIKTDTDDDNQINEERKGTEKWNSTNIYLDNVADNDNDNEALLDSELMNNLIHEDVFKNIDNDDDDDNQLTLLTNKNIRPQSARNKSNHYNDQLTNRNNFLSVVHEESDDAEDNVDDMQHNLEKAKVNIGNVSMSQMGLINIANNEPSSNRKTIEESVFGIMKNNALIVNEEQINEQHQSLNGNRQNLKLLEEINEKEHQLESNAKKEALEVDDYYEEEEFDSESNSNPESNYNADDLNKRIVLDDFRDNNEFFQRFNETTKEMQSQITNLRKELQNELNLSHELLRNNMNDEIDLLKNSIDILQHKHRDDIDLLSNKINELNLSSVRTTNKELTVDNNTSDKLNELIRDRLDDVVNDLNENVEQQLMKLTDSLDKTIVGRMDKISKQTENKLLKQQEQMIMEELSSRLNSTELFMQNKNETKRLCEKLNEQFNSVVSEIRSLYSRNNESLENVKMVMEKQLNFADNNFKRIGQNIALLEKKTDESKYNQEKSSVTWNSFQQQQLKEMINTENVLLNKKVNQLENKIESLVQQIDSKLKFFEMNEAKLQQDKKDIQLLLEKIQKETSTLIPSYNNNDNKHLPNSNSGNNEISEKNKPNYYNDSSNNHHHHQQYQSREIFQIKNQHNVNSNCKLTKCLSCNNDDNSNSINRQHNDQNNKAAVLINYNNVNNNNNDTDAMGEEKVSISTNSNNQINQKLYNLQLLEQCNNLKKLLECYVDDPDLERKHLDNEFNNARKRYEMRKYHQQYKSLLMNNRNERKYRLAKRNQLPNHLNGHYHSINDEQLNSESLALSSSSSSYDITSSSIYFNNNNHHSNGLYKSKQKRWSKSSPDLNYNLNYKFGFNRGGGHVCYNIMPNELIKNRSYANVLSAKPKTDNVSRNQMQMASNSLIKMIKRTGNQLKQELNNFDMLDNYHSGRMLLHNVGNGENDMANILPSANNTLLDKFNEDKKLSSFNKIDNNNCKPPTTNDQLLIFRLRSICDSVNERLMKISSAIDQQKITQI